MTRVLITDHELADRLIGERKSSGQDTYDEMWDGVYRVVPAGNGAHGYVQMQIGALLTAEVRRRGFACTGPINIGDEHNYDARPGHTYNRQEDSAVLQRSGFEVWLEDQLGWPRKGITCSL